MVRLVDHDDGGAGEERLQPRPRLVGAAAQQGLPGGAHDVGAGVGDGRRQLGETVDDAHGPVERPGHRACLLHDGLRRLVDELALVRQPQHAPCRVRRQVVQEPADHREGLARARREHDEATAQGSRRRDQLVERPPRRALVLVRPAAVGDVATAQRHSPGAPCHGALTRPHRDLLGHAVGVVEGAHDQRSDRRVVLVGAHEAVHVGRCDLARAVRPEQTQLDQGAQRLDLPASTTGQPVADQQRYDQRVPEHRDAGSEDVTSLPGGLVVGQRPQQVDGVVVTVLVAVDLDEQGAGQLRVDHVPAEPADGACAIGHRRGVPLGVPAVPDDGRGHVRRQDENGPSHPNRPQGADGCASLVRTREAAMTVHAEEQQALERALEVLRDGRAVAASLRTFYDPGGDYAGPTFDAPRTSAPAVTAADLLAITTMGVSARPKALRNLLDPGSPVGALLPDVPDTPLAQADDALLLRGVELHLSIKALLSDGNAWVTASKLAARLRPALAPVRDSVVIARLGLANRDVVQDWRSFRHVVRDREVVGLLSEARDAVTAGGTNISHVPDLRLLDVALWMAWSKGAAPDRRAPSESEGGA